MKKSSLSLTTLAVLAIPAVAGASPQPSFTCKVSPHPALQRNGYSLGENIYYGGELVGLTGYPDESEKLSRVPSGSGEKYSNGIITFHTKGDEGVLVVEADQATFPCKKVGFLGLGQSIFGSIIREAPDAGSRKLDSIPEGEMIELVEETGVMFDGWQWIKIRYGEGQPGYVWGGTICSRDGDLPGVHPASDCPR